MPTIYDPTNALATKGSNNYQEILNAEEILQNVLASGGQALRTASEPLATDPGLSDYRNTALLATKSEVKASAGSIYGLKFINPNTSPVFVKIYAAAAASVTVGTTTPKRVEMVPPGDGTTPGTLIYAPESMPVQYFAAGITIAAVTTAADAATTAPGTALHAEIIYK